MILEIIGLILLGLVIGALGRLALPGPDPMGIGTTILIGVAASLISGLIMRVVFDRVGWSFLVAVLVSTGIVYLVRRSRGGTATTPAPPRGGYR